MHNGRHTEPAAGSSRPRRRLLAVAAVVLAAFAFVAPAAAWAPVQIVAQNDSDVPFFALGTGAGDVTAAVWVDGTGNTGTVWGATRSSSGGFGTPVPVSPFGDTDASTLDVAVGPDGSATAIWSQDITYAVRTATRPAGASAFGSPATIDAGPSLWTDIAIADDGTALAVWMVNVGAGTVIRAALRPAGADTFGPAQLLSDPGRRALTPTALVAADGSFTVVWLGDRGGVATIEAATRPAGGQSFGAAETIASTGQTFNISASYGAAMAGDGAATVAWIDGTTQALRTSTRPANASAFGLPDVVTSPGAGVQLDTPHVAVAPGGAVVVVWWAAGQGRESAHAAVRTAGASDFGASQELASGPSVSDPAVTVAPDGRFTTAWFRGSGGATRDVQTATLEPGASSFAPAETAAADRDVADPPVVVAARDGTPVVLWNGGTGINTGFNAVFATWGAPTTYPLTATRTGTGTGRVASTQPGIDCGATCTATVPLSSRVTLTATPTGGSTFGGWSGACSGTSTTCVVSVLGTRTVTARFNAARPGKVRVARSSTTPAGAEIVRWRAPGSTGGTRLLYYQTRHRTKGGAWSGWERQELQPRRRMQTRHYPALVPGRAYAVEIRAVNRIGPGRPVLVSFRLPADGSTSAVTG